MEKWIVPIFSSLVTGISTYITVKYKHTARIEKERNYYTHHIFEQYKQTITTLKIEVNQLKDELNIIKSQRKEEIEFYENKINILLEENQKFKKINTHLKKNNELLAKRISILEKG